MGNIIQNDVPKSSEVQDLQLANQIRILQYLQYVHAFAPLQLQHLNQMSYVSAVFIFYQKIQNVAFSQNVSFFQSKFDEIVSKFCGSSSETVVIPGDLQKSAKFPEI